MSSAETTKNEKLLKVFVTNFDKEVTDTAEGNFVLVLMGKKVDEVTRYTLVKRGEVTGTDIFRMVEAIKDVVIPSLLKDIGVSEEEMDTILNSEEDTHGNS